MKDKAQNVLKTFKELDEQMANTPPGDTARMTTLGKERKRLEPVVQTAQEWLRVSTELSHLEEMITGSDAGLADLARSEKPALQEQFQVLDKKLYRLLNPPDPRADRDTIVEIRPAAGGDEAGLFCGDLFRMYQRWAQKKNLELTIYSLTPQGVGGYKEITFAISGVGAYAWFKYEQGVHRVQRVPKTEAQGRIHTSTVTVAVLPEPTEVEIKIETKDLRIDTYRASGAGGQHVNKTESAIRITHVPTGVVVACQEERSQGQNKLRAMTLLRAKLQEAAEEKMSNEHKAIRKKQVGSGDRSEKIRTYNFPQDRITDHRINISVFNMENFLSGEMDELVAALQSKEEELFKEERPQ